MADTDRRNAGFVAALLTPVFMGMAPIFGKLAIRSGMDAFTVAALRTVFAALVLWIVFGLFFRKFTYIFPAGLIGTFVVGAVNGLGSLLYYNGLLLLDNASLAQLLYMTYVIFAMLLSRIYGHRISAMSLVRAGLALVAIYLLTASAGGQGGIHWLGVGLMLGGAFLYALHVVLSQRVMFEMPAPTMALYALTFMGLVVLAARLVVGPMTNVTWSPAMPVGWYFIIGLTVVTAASRLTLFAGVREIGPLQTILLNMAEIMVTLLVAFVWLGERMALVQWIGVGVLLLSVFLARWDADTEFYRPLVRARHLRGDLRAAEEPMPPSPFGVVTNLYRRPPDDVSAAAVDEADPLADLRRAFPNLDLSGVDLADLPDLPPSTDQK